MPTYTPLQSVVLTSPTDTITFSNIPQIYQDLVIVMSSCSSYSPGMTQFRHTFNGSTAANYSSTYLRSDGSSVTSARSNSGSSGGYMGTMNYNSSPNFTTCVLHLLNYANTTTFKTHIQRNGDVNTYSELSVSLWAQTAAITSISIGPGAGYMLAGSTFDLYGVGGANALTTPKAVGGDAVMSDGTYWYHAFKTSATFTPLQSLTADVLVIAGGGSGGASNNIYNTAGGGGAGGVYYSTGNSISSVQTVTVGAGASGASAGIQGSNSVFGSLTAAVGGGAGGNYFNGSVTGGNGGSGGGGSSLGSYAGGSATSGQGYAGGNGNTSRVGAGGGGAGAAGSNSVSEPNGGNGGAGTNTYSTWLSATGTGVSGYIAGGGGGGNSPAYGGATGGVGGSGGGGSSSATSGTVGGSGVSNTGGGGGAGTGNGTAPYYGGNGGSGLVIVRYAV